MKNAARAAFALLVVFASVSKAASAENSSWSGLYFGISADLSENSGATFATVGPPVVSSAKTLEDNDVSVTVTVVAGANYQIGDAVLGLQLEASPFSSTVDRVCRFDWQYGYESNVLVYDIFDAPCSRRISLTTSVLAKAGVLLSSNTLIYGLAGWTTAIFRDDLTALATLQNLSSRHHGFTFGGGIEHRITLTWHLNAEVRATHFHDANEAARVVDTLSEDQQFSHTQANSTSIRIGLTYHLQQ